MNKKFNLSGKKAIVTGGGSGIGEAIVQSLASAGAVVHILDISLEESNRVSAESEGVVYAHKCDVCNGKQTWNLVNEIADGEVNILVNNAGIAHVGNIENTTSEDMQRLFNVNVMGVFNGVKAALPFMKSKGGSIINMASVASSVGIYDRFAYTMTKGAVFSLTMSLAKDYLKYNIRCNSVSPARVHTPFVDGFLARNYPGKEKEMFENLSKTQPIGRMGNPHEVGDLVLYLVSDEASFITGSDFSIDGGFTKLNT